MNTSLFCLRRAVSMGTLVAMLWAQPSAAEARASSGDVAAPRNGENEKSARSLSLRDALARALSGSPELASFSWEIRGAEARTLQAGLFPNPTIRADFENIGGSGHHDGVDTAETTLTLSQLIELGGKRDRRRKIGAHQVKIAEWEYEVARLDVIAETTSAFVDALARQENLRVADEQIRRIEETLREMEDSIRAGAVSSAEATRAKLELRTQQLERKLRKRALRVACVRLATVWGETEPTFSTLDGDLRAVTKIPSEAALVGRMASSPKLARWKAEIAARRAEMALEDSQRFPDLLVGLGPRHFIETDDWALIVGVELPIPVFDRNQAGRRESQTRLASSREQQRSAELRLRRALSASYQGLASAWDEVTFLRDDAIPTAMSAYEDLKRAHGKGALPLAEVLESQDSIFAMQTRLVEVLASYHLSRAEIESLIGGPIDREDEPRS